MNAEKSQAYKKLVADMQKQYPIFGKSTVTALQGTSKKASSTSKDIARNFYQTFDNDDAFIKTLVDWGLTWRETKEEKTTRMWAINALSLAVEDGFNPFNAITKKDSPVELFAPVVNGENICKEINLYTYWQGFGYAEKTPKIKYLLVAQDWGNLFRATPQFFQDIKTMNETGKWIKPYNKVPKGNGTNENLFRLFEVLNRDLLKLNDDVFFTNFCLGYRSGKEVGGMTKKLMMQDAEIFKRLCEILEPENILCLGQITFECVYESLTGKNYSVKGSYNNFIENHEEFIVRCGNVESKIFPLAHCGYMGTMNRNKNLPKHDDRLFYQKQDWKKIAGLKTTEFTRKFLSNKYLTKKFFADARFIYTIPSQIAGDDGGFEVWTKNFKHYIGSNVEKFYRAFMKSEKITDFDDFSKNGWCHFYMGFGYNFFIKKELADSYVKRFKMHPVRIKYESDGEICPAEEIMLELLNEPLASDVVSAENNIVQQIKHMESAINKFDLQDNIKIYRRADISLLKYFEKILQVGGIFQDDGFTSCTTLNIGSSENEIEVVVLVPKGKGYGAYIAPISAFPEECEFVLNHGTIFKVRSIKEVTPKNFRVVIEVIGRSPKELF